MLSKPYVLPLSAALLVAPARKSTVAEPEATATVLTGSTLIGEYSAATLTGRVQSVPLAGALVRYPIRAYRLTYCTRTPEDAETTAFGLILNCSIPESTFLGILVPLLPKRCHIY